jgi:hypothetical protein
MPVAVAEPIAVDQFGIGHRPAFTLISGVEVPFDAYVFEAAAMAAL